MQQQSKLQILPDCRVAPRWNGERQWRTGMKRACTIFAALLAACAVPATDPDVDDISDWLVGREVQPRHDLDGAEVSLWSVEEKRDHFVLSFRLSNLSDRTLMCTGFASPPFVSDYATCLIIDPAGYHLDDDGKWRERWWWGGGCAVGMPPPYGVAVAPGEAALLLLIEAKDELRSVRVGASVKVDGSERRVCSEAITAESVRRIAGRK